MRNIYACILVGCILIGCSANQTDQLLDTILEVLEEEAQPVPVSTPSAPELPTPSEPPISQPEPIKPQEPKEEKKPLDVDKADCRGAPYNCCWTRRPDKARELKWEGQKGGFFWKPESDHHAGGIFGLAGWYGKAKSVQICCSKGCENLTDGDGGNPDPEGCRHHWRTKKSSRQLKRELGDSCAGVVDGRNEKLKIKNLGERTE